MFGFFFCFSMGFPILVVRAGISSSSRSSFLDAFAVLFVDHFEHVFDNAVVFVRRDRARAVDERASEFQSVNGVDEHFELQILGGFVRAGWRPVEEVFVQVGCGILFVQLVQDVTFARARSVQEDLVVGLGAET